MSYPSNCELEGGSASTEADLLNGVAWLKTIRSESVPGLSAITFIFEPGTDIMRLRQSLESQ